MLQGHHVLRYLVGNFSEAYNNIEWDFKVQINTLSFVYHNAMNVNYVVKKEPILLYALLSRYRQVCDERIIQCMDIAQSYDQVDELQITVPATAIEQESESSVLVFAYKELYILELSAEKSVYIVTLKDIHSA